MALNILGVGGSLRAGSRSTRALAVCLDGCRKHGAAVRLLDLRTLDLPLFRPEESTEHPAVREAAAAVGWADAFLLATPDYHGSMSGAVKNFLDYHWKEFAGKLFGFVCSSHEKGLTAMDQMRTVVRQCYGWSLPYGVALHGDQDFGPEGTITNHKVTQRLEMTARDLVVYGALLRRQFTGDVSAKVPDSFATRYGH